MQQWDRDTSGRLNRISTQPYLASGVSAQTDTMDPIPEEQQSQPGTPMNPNANRTMRDHIHPPRVSAPSCIVPPADDVAVRPYLVPLLPTYHGMENENPYTHLRDFEEVCTTFKEGMMDMDLLKLKAFPLTLKDKAKIWLNSLRPRTIRDWAELQAEFLKKFFSAHKTNNLKRQIYTFAAQEGEKFYQCWERFMETSNACPHHGFDTWMLVNHFYDGISPPMKQLVETMCGGNFLSKHPDEAMDYLHYIAETSKAWDEPRPREDEGQRHSSYQGESIHTISEKTLMIEKLNILTRRMDEMEMKNQHNIHSVNEFSASQPSCYNPQSPQSPQPLQSIHPLEQAMLDLNWIMDDYVEANKKIRAHSIVTVEDNLNKKIDGLKDDFEHKWDNLHDFSEDLIDQQECPPEEECQSGTRIEEQRVVTVQANQETETIESSMDKELDGFQSESDQKLDIQQEPILKPTNQFVHPEEENLEEESQEEESLTETVLVEQAQLQPQEELEVESLEAPEALQEASVNFWPWTKEKEITALLTEKSSEHEGTQEPIIQPNPQPNPINLDTLTTAQDTKTPLPAAPPESVYILPTPAQKSKPSAPAPKGKSNTSLHAMQNIRRLVASVHTFATTSKKMANAYIAWHSGWFGCGFGFGAPGPRHF